MGYTTAALAMGEMVSRLTTDVNEFLAADPDAPIPASLRQACRLLNTPELEECAARVTSGVARGAMAAAMASGDDHHESGDGDGEGERGEGTEPSTSSSSPQAVVDRILDRVLDTSNWGLVSVIVSSTTRQTLEAVIDVMKEQYAAQQGGENGEGSSGEGGGSNGGAGGGAGGSGGGGASSSTVNDVILPWLDRQPERMLALAASAEGKSVLLDLCSCFVSNAVGVYLEKTAGSNTFDDFFTAASNANNREVMQDIAGRVTGEAVRTVVEVVSPGMVSPRAPGTAARRAARERRGAGGGDLERRREGLVFQTPAPVPEIVGGGGGEAGEGGEGEGVNEMMMTPGVVAANGFVSPGDDAMSEDSLNDRRHHPASSPSSSDTAADDPVHATRGGARGAAAGTDTSAAAAAAFTSAIVHDVAPHMFRVMVAPEGRQLITEVAGTCTASAVRSFVLSLRDCVFFVNGTNKPGGGGGGGSLAMISLKNAVRVAVVAWFVFYLFHFLYTGVYAAAGYVMAAPT